MKKTLFTILFLTCSVSFSQIKNDLTEIIEIIVTDYKSDTINVYHRFKNFRLLSDLDRLKSDKDSKIHEKYDSELDSNGININWEIEVAEMYDDSVTVNIERLKVKFFPSITFIDKKENKRIKRYFKTKYEKNKRKKPIAYISVPLISTDGKKAIVYGSYICGSLCGSGGVFHLEKINGKWKIADYVIRWIS